MKLPSFSLPLLRHVVPASLAIAAAVLAPTALAATYTYTPPGGGGSADWSTGTNWTGSTAPLSGTDTTLSFGGSVTGTVTTTYDVGIAANPFLLNTLTLGASGATTFSTQNYNIAAASGKSFKFSLDGATTPVLNLNSNFANNQTNIQNTVSVNATIDGGSLVIQGNGTAKFTYSGNLADGNVAATITKNGNSTLSLSGNNTFSGGLILNSGSISLSSAGSAGTGAITINGGVLDNISGAAVTLSTNNAQNWNSDFTFGGNSFASTSALNMGTGAVTLNGNRTLVVNGAVNGSGALTIGGAIGGSGGLTMAGSANQGTGTLVLNGTNTYAGPTTINAGVLRVGSVAALGGSGTNVNVNYGGTLSTSYALDQTTVNRIAAGSEGTVALGANSSNNLDFSATGANAPLTLGASGASASTYTGILTPHGTTYRVGGGYGTLNFNSAMSGAGNSLVVGGGGSPGTVNLGVASTHGGGTTVIGGNGSAVSPAATTTTNVSVLQTNLTGSTSPFGTGSILLNNGVLGFGTAPTALTSGQSMNVSLGALTVQGQGEIRLNKGASTQPVPITVTLNSLNRNANSILYVTPSATGNLGVTEKLLVTNQGNVSLTPVNGMISGSIINFTGKNFLTYDPVNGFTNAATTSQFGVNNIVSISADPGTVVNAYALKIGSGFSQGANTTFNVGAGGVISEGIHNSSATINFGSTPGLFGAFISGNQSFLMPINATNGVTFYGTGMTLVGTNLNISGGLTFDSGTWSLSSNPVGSNPFQAAYPNAMTINRGAVVRNSANTPMTIASLSGEGLITSNDPYNSSFVVTINGGTDTGTTNFSGDLTDANLSLLSVTKTGLNTQSFSGTNTYRGTTTASGGTLKGTQTKGTPFGTGNVVVAGGNLSVAPSGSGQNVAVSGANNAANSTFTYGANGQLSLDKGANTSLTYTVGNSAAAANSVLVRGANGTLVVAPASGISNLGTASGEKFVVNGGVATTNGIVSAAIIGQETDANQSGTFLGYDNTNGLVAGVYTDTNFAAPSSTSVEDVTTATSTNTASVYALRASDTLTVNAGNTLTVGDGTQPAGVILNGGSVQGGTLAFGASPAVIYTSKANGSVGSAVTGSGGVSVVGPGKTTFSGTNTYTGGTSINNTTLSISNNNNLGAAAGVLNLNGGVLESTATINLGTRAVALAVGQNSLGGTLDVASGTTLTVGGVVSGSGNLVKSGSGSAVLSGTNTFTGQTSVTGGTLNLANSLALQSSTLTTGGIVFESSVGSHAFTVGGLHGNFGLNLQDNAVTPNAVALTVGNNNISTTYTGTLSGTGSLTKTGTGTLTLTGGASSYTGQTKIQGGTVVASSLNSVSGGSSSSSLGAPTTVGNGTIALGSAANPGTLQYVGTGETTDRVIDLAGTTNGGTISASGTGALKFTSNFTATGAGAKTLVLSGNSDPSIENEISGVIVNSSGATAVTKSGANTWVLSGLNSYTGATTVGTGGTLKLGSAGNGTNGPLGTTAGSTTVNANGTLDLNGFSLSTSEALTLNGNGVTNGIISNGALTNSKATAVTYSGLVTLASASKITANAGDIALTNAGTITGAFGLTLDGTSTGSSIASIVGIGAGGITKQGTGTWTLSGANTYSGTTTVNGGTLKGTQAANDPFGTGNVSISNGNLSLAPSGSGSNVTVTGARAVVGSTFTYGGNSQITLDKGSQNSLTYTIGNSGATANSVLVRGTSGNLIVSAASGMANLGTASGEKFIVNGGVSLTNGIVNAAIIGQDTDINKSGTFLGYNATNGLVAATYTDTNFTAASSTSVEDVNAPPAALNSQTIYALRNSSAITINSGQTLTIGNNAGTTSAGIILNGGSISGGTVAVGASPAVIYSNLLDGSISSAITGTAGVTVTGPGVTTLSSTSSTYTGTVAVNGSTLSVAGNGSLGNTANAVTLNNGTLRTASTFSTGARAVTVAGPAGGTFDVAGSTTLTVGGIVSGSGGVSKTNSGTLALTGANTYTGATAVTGGTFLVSGTINGTSRVTVTGGTFNYANNATSLNRDVTVAGGDFKYNSSNAYTGALTFTSGTISGSGNLSNTTLTFGNGQTLSPGNSPGTLTTGGQTWANGGSYLWEINALATSTIPGAEGTDPGWDFANISGALAITAGVGQYTLYVDSLLALDNWNSAASYQWRIATASGGVTGFASNVFTIDTSAFGDQNAFGGQFAVTNIGNDIFLTYAVPEPSAAVLLFVGMALCVGVRRRQRA